MITYEIHRPFLMQRAKEGVPFLSFDQFHNLVKLYRDDFYAAQNVAGFAQDIGQNYNVWTVDCQSRYHRHLWFSEVRAPVWISFEVAEPSKPARLPLQVRIFDAGGLYFEQLQHICFERRVGQRFQVCSWRKIEPVRSFISGEIGEGPRGAMPA
ncbi:hypothetical protein [Paenirhodobacter sp.]|uniref:hypothetical protein n=1 Tax=Paenirhodobacter sp. TaxID=1965326 RepID=UPI003D0FD8C3